MKILSYSVSPILLGIGDSRNQIILIRLRAVQVKAKPEGVHAVKIFWFLFSIKKGHNAFN